MTDKSLDVSDYVSIALLAPVGAMDLATATKLFEDDLEMAGLILNFMVSVEQSKGNAEGLNELIGILNETRENCLERLDNILEKLEALKEAE